MADQNEPAHSDAERKVEAQVPKLAPLVRGLLAEPSGDDDVPYRRVILRSVTTEEARQFAASDTRHDLRSCPIPLGDAETPPLCVDALDCNAEPEQLRAELRAAIEGHTKAHGSKPTVLLLPGLGVFYVEQTAETGLPLHNEVALVTGAAGAIGSGICLGLIEQGCRVAATDLPGEHLDGLVDELNERAPDRAIGVPLDVTDRRSVTHAFDQVSRVWGGVDIVIANAGIPLISSLVEMEIEDFRRLEEVNVEGTMLTLSEGGRHLCLQGTGGDMVVVSTKNVFAPGARFGAYSATKAAAHQLGRIASLELAEFDIRVNMVAPDAVFSSGERKSGLWEKIGPDRMRHKGITGEQELREHYRTRNLLKATVTARHVANAVLFFVTRQTPTTGATIPVDGGLPDAAPR